MTEDDAIWQRARADELRFDRDRIDMKLESEIRRINRAYDDLVRHKEILREGLITAIRWLDLETPDPMRALIAKALRDTTPE